MQAYDLFLREVRKQLAVQNITQVDLAKRICADRGNLNQQISGKRHTMKAKTLFDVAKALGISLDAIMEGAQ